MKTARYVRIAHSLRLPRKDLRYLLRAADTMGSLAYIRAIPHSMYTLSMWTM